MPDVQQLGTAPGYKTSGFRYGVGTTVAMLALVTQVDSAVIQGMCIVGATILPCWYMSTRNQYKVERVAASADAKVDADNRPQAGNV